MPSLLHDQGNPLPFEITEDNANKKIWRYMDILKFISFLKEGAIFFSNIKNFDDPWEGCLSKKDVTRINDHLSEKERYGDKDIVKVSGSHFVNCWHISDYESEVFWKLYSENKKGIAITSTVKKLHECFLNEYTLSGQNCHVCISSVEYIDYAKDPALSHTTRSSNWLYPLIHKKKSFAYENELRAIILPLSLKPGLVGNGFNLEIDVYKLIEDIIVSPFYSEWESQIIQDVVSKYLPDFSESVSRSTLLTELC